MTTTAMTSNWRFHHTMLRVRDENSSVEFYSKNFGMQKIKELTFTDFKLIFLAFPCETEHWTDREGVLELTVNFNNENFKPSNGNVEPHKGFGHICFSVSNINQTCQRLQANGVTFQKRLEDGNMKNIAFVLDPDGYWIELIDNGMKDEKDVMFNHTMIRVQDADKSLHFFQNVLGMSLLKTAHHNEGEFSLYFLAYPNSENNVFQREGVLELTHNWKHDLEFKGYCNGNKDPKGFGHIAITVDDLDEACKKFTNMNVKFQKRLEDGNMKDIAFILTPDEEYWVEILQNERHKKRVGW